MGDVRREIRRQQVMRRLMAAVIGLSASGAGLTLDSVPALAALMAFMFVVAVLLSRYHSRAIRRLEDRRRVWPAPRVPCLTFMQPEGDLAPGFMLMSLAPASAAASDIGRAFGAGLLAGTSMADVAVGMARLSAAAGPCAHSGAVPVNLLVTGETVAWLCPGCDSELPAGWAS